MYSERLQTIFKHSKLPLFILRTLEKREKKINISEAPVLSLSSLAPLYTIPCAVNIADSRMLGSQGKVPTLEVIIHFFLPGSTMQRRTEIILRKLLETLLQELTLELALAISLRSPRFLNISRFSC